MIYDRAYRAELGELPEPPDNPSFLELSDEAQAAIDGRFQRGISALRARVDAMDLHDVEIHKARAAENVELRAARMIELGRRRAFQDQVRQEKYEARRLQFEAERIARDAGKKRQGRRS